MPRPEYPKRQFRLRRTHPSLTAALRGPAWVSFMKRRRSRRGDEEDGGVPVEPNRPNTLSGGAAAALEFDE
jgi:hypothetical protein